MPGYALFDPSADKVSSGARDDALHLHLRPKVKCSSKASALGKDAARSASLSIISPRPFINLAPFQRPRAAARDIEFPGRPLALGSYEKFNCSELARRKSQSTKPSAKMGSFALQKDEFHPRRLQKRAARDAAEKSPPLPMMMMMSVTRYPRAAA